MTTKIDSFWANDLKILFKANKLFDIIPSSKMTNEQKMNAMVRCSIYFSVIHYLVRKNSNILFIPIVVSIMTYIFYINNTEKTDFAKTIEKFTEKLQKSTDKSTDKSHSNKVSPYFESSINNDNNWSNEDLSDLTPGDQNNINDIYDDNDCKLPSIDNPFGNVMITDIGNPKFKKACDSYNNNMVKRDIKNDFEEGLYMDVNDIYSKKNSQRQFYTMPNTDIVNDQGGFAKWCYMTPPTCKEGNSLQCSANLSNFTGLNTDNLLLGGPTGSKNSVAA